MKIRYLIIGLFGFCTSCYSAGIVSYDDAKENAFIVNEIRNNFRKELNISSSPRSDCSIVIIHSSTTVGEQEQIVKIVEYIKSSYVMNPVRVKFYNNNVLIREVLVSTE